ncbi:MAG TPA: hypothetical protein VLH94_00225 [Spirochaetia bacterium]|nr:hypothetical protein [Spirochaetia bacterium]
MKRNLHWILIGLAVIIRILLSASTYHSDLGAFASSGKYIAGEGKWLTFYDQIASKDASGNLVVHRDDVVFNYQPLAYILPSIVYLPFNSVIKQTGEQFMNRNWVTSQNTPFVPLLSLYKLPMILADLAMLWLLPMFFIKEKNKKLAQLIWAFNPIAIFVSSVMGQVDIVITLLLTAALLSYKNKKLFLSIILIALSSLIKPIGLILIPLILIPTLQNKKYLKTLALGLVGVGTYILGILPFIGSASYRYYALFAEQINKSTYAGISIASGHDIPLFFIVYILILFLSWGKKISFRTAFGTALLSSLAFSHFHPQWLVWLTPWLIIYSIEKKNFLFYIATLLCWFGVLFSFDETLHLQTFLQSKLMIPTVIRLSNFFKEIVQLSRAGLVASLFWYLK